MNILHIAYRLEESSAATRIAKAQADRHQVFFLLGRRSKSPFVAQRQIFPVAASLLGVSLHILEILVFKMFGIARQEIFSFDVASFPQRMLLKYICRIKRIDVVHLHWGGYSFFPLAAWTPSTAPMVATAHDFNLFTGGCHVPMECDQMNSGCESCPLSCSSAGRRYIRCIRDRKSGLLNAGLPVVTAPSAYAQGRILKAYPFLKTVVVGNTAGDVYEREIDPVQLKSLYQQERHRNGMATVISVGTNWSQRQNKGQDILAYVLERLCQAGVRVRYVSVGRYEQYDGICDRAHYDSVSPLELRSLYALSDLCLVTSRYETFSQVSLESILCGTPVIAFDNSGPRDIVVHGETGFLVPAFSEEGFFRTTVANLDFKLNNIESIWKGSRETSARFSSKSITSAFDNVYRRATAAATSR